MTRQSIGASCLRREDRRFLTGRGRYTGDRPPADVLTAVFVRSPLAHASMTITDRDAALAQPGVVAVLTAADMAADGVAPLSASWNLPNADGSASYFPAMHALADGRVRYVGQPCAMVVATSDAAARDGAENLAIDFHEMPAAATLDEATAPGAPAVWDDCPSNISLDWTNGDAPAAARAFAGAAHQVELDLVNQRITAMPMEPRLAIARYDAGADRLTCHVSNQLPHELQRAIAAALSMPETRVDVVAEDVGGGFGMKSYSYPEDIAVAWAAHRLRRDIAWTSERNEAFQADAGARDHVARVRLALDADLRFLALDIEITANMGAYLSQHAHAVPTIYCTYSIPGPYRFESAHVRVRAVLSHSAPIDAYRGAGRSEAVYMTERVIDHAARKLGLDAVDLRRRNLIEPRHMPFTTAFGMTLQDADAPRLLERALETADRAGFRARLDEAKHRGCLRGFGMALHAAACGGCSSADNMAVGALVGNWESARLQVHPSGAATLYVGSHNHGQGHETAFSQLVVERTGLPFEAIEVVFGDTRRVQRGMGTFASRSAVVCGPAITLACDRVTAKAREIAAWMLEAPADDIELEDGRFTIAGTDRSLAFGDVARAAYLAAGFGEDDREPGLDETGFHDPLDFTWPFGAHIAEVEIDPATGVVALVRYVAVDDVGVEINPLIVEGQIHGGIVQGAGQALMEAIRYDPASGQLLTGSFLDYAMPRADSVPSFVSERIACRSSVNSLGVKGVGEVGTFAAPAAVINAVVDALAVAGVTTLDMPATPLRVWQALNAASLPD
ncbi:MAG: xanthine dehydrogenase family protein molybdopterin-binding subunit [bacterium]|nr:xanthine dehydrogenase family protein molybdopterin-binding subunit [bacterium]